MAKFCPSGCKPADDDRGNCPYLTASYILAGLAMMLNIRLSYSSAPYALIRFRLPENLFSVFVRRMASALELWCLPGFIIADIMELAVKLIIKLIINENNNFNSKTLKFGAIIWPSIIAQWLNFLTYVILFFVYLMGGDSGSLTTFYWTIAVSGFVFGINNVFVFAADYNYIPIYIAGENCFPALTSFMHYITTLMFGNRRKYESDFLIVGIDIIVAILISFVAAAVWTVAYGICRDAAPMCEITYEASNQNKLKIKYKDANDYKIDGKLTSAPAANTPITVKGPKNIPYTFKLTTAQLAGTTTPITDTVTIGYGHIFAEGFGSLEDVKASMASPLLIVLVGMGLVYAIYPGIAPGMIVPFYLIDKIEMVLLIATIFPPVIIALLQKFESTKNWSPKTKVLAHKSWKFPGWEFYYDHKYVQGSGFEENKDHPVYAQYWHFFDILMILMIILAAIFIYSLHYRESNISRSIVNQPKMSTALTIIFYMCHEISLAVGFAGMVANGAEYTVLAQMIGAFLMVFLALYSEGYIIEYKSHDPAHWHTERMARWDLLFISYYLVII